MVKTVKQKHWWEIHLLEKWETANPNWRPRKGISQVNKRLTDNWYDPAKKEDIIETYLSMIQLDKEWLEALKKKEDTLPLLSRILLKNLTSWKTFDILEKLLDRTLWKAIQQTENKNENIGDPVQIIIPNNNRG